MTDPSVSFSASDGTVNHQNVDQSNEDHSNGHQDEPADTSYVTVHGEWENRPISIFGVVKRFISSLSYGADLTRLSMPSEFLNPYSILEMGAGKYLSTFPLLFEASKQEDPLMRMTIVTRWFLSSVRGGKLYKKPYNSVVDESHICYIDTPESGVTTYVGEQVSHHPPISAFYMVNEKEKVSVVGNILFDVKFYINSAQLTTTGYLKIRFGNTGEEYILNKGYPDLLLKNVVFGTRKMLWSSSLDIYCEQTGCLADITFSISGNDDVVAGKISQNDRELMTFSGCVDDVVTFQNLESDEEDALLDPSHVLHPQIICPRPPKDDPYPSLRVWRTVTKAIIDNNMDAADQAKVEIEQEQRRRCKQEGADDKTERKYFTFNEDAQQWVYREGSLTIPTPPTK